MNARTHQIDVKFDPTTGFTFSPSGEIEITTNRGVVIFTLKESPAALFPSNPIQWVDDQKKPIDPPDGATVHRTGLSTTVTITPLRPNHSTIRFYLLVQTSNGEFFGSDPTIVTMRPGGG